MRVVLVLYAGLLLAQSNQPNPNTGSEKTGINKRHTQQQAGDTQADKPAPPHVTNTFDVQAPHPKDEQGNPYDAAKDTLYRAYLLFTIIGVCGGLGALAVLIAQTIATNKAAEAAKVSADAANKSVKAIVGMERAWILVERESYGSEQLFTMTNYGRTPARIIFFDVRDYLISRVDNMPKIPPYGDGVLDQKRLLAPGGEWEHFERWDMNHLGDDIVNEIKEPGKRKLVLFGVVRYNDVLDESIVHETRFCYVWTGRPEFKFHIGGPPQYTQHT